MVLGCGAGSERPAVPIDTYKAKDASVVAIAASGKAVVLGTQDVVYGAGHVDGDAGAPV